MIEDRQDRLAARRLASDVETQVRLLLPGEGFRSPKAAAGEFERHPLTDGTYAYYVYDLLDWFLSR